MKGGRQRSQCVIRRSSNSLPETEPSEAEINSRKSVILEDKFSNHKKTIRRQTISNRTTFNLGNLRKPMYTGTKKVYGSGADKNIFFHEKAQLIGNLNKDNMGELTDEPQMLSFSSLLIQFKNEEELDEVDINDLIDIDHEKLCELKDKAIDFIDATSMLIEEKETLGVDTTTEQSLIEFFMEKSIVNVLI